jgi:2-dehydro-3-deoxygalactonokinase
MADPAFLAVDWGTTNCRAWVVDANGGVGAERDFPLGVSRLGPGEAGERFRTEVRPALGAERLPALMAGMIGSTLGWIEAPYLDCPIDARALGSGLVAVPGEDPPVRIVPGLRGRGVGGGPDVMRGEETQVLGWLSLDPTRLQGTRVICHPGTHAKWVLVEDGAIERFVTAMTGELFDILSRHSVLKPEDAPEDLAAFDEGLEAAGDGGALAARLFTARARVVGGKMPKSAVKSYLSGLLIGADVAGAPALLAEPVKEVALIGDPRLCRLYARALEHRSVANQTYDGSEAVLSGLKTLFAQGGAR